jgi:hypothetical protein
MSTFVIPVDKKQKKVLKTILEYLNLPFQEVDAAKDFWSDLTPIQQNDIEQGIADADANRVKPIHEILGKYK